MSMTRGPTPPVRKARPLSTRDVWAPAGVAVAAMLLAAAEVWPWVTLGLWLVAGGLFSWAIAFSAWRPLVRFALGVGALAIGLSAWWMTSPRADVRVVEFVPVQSGSERTASVGVNIVFQNFGKWPADVRAVSQIGLYEAVPFENVERRAALEDHVKSGLGSAQSSAQDFRVDRYERRSYTVTGELSEEQRTALQAGRLTAYIAAEIRYRDWRFWERGSRVCVVASGGVPPIVQCLGYIESW